MKKYNLDNKLKHFCVSWMLVIFAGLFFAACNDDYLSNPVLPEPEGKAAIVLSVNTPQPTLPLKFTRAQSVSESRISDVTVLVFEHTNDEYIYKYYTNGTEITATSDYQTRFKVLLSGTRNPLKFILLTNTANGFLGSAPSPGTPESVVRRQLVDNFPSTGWQRDLPMYGEILLPNGTTGLESQVLQVTLLRSVARVDVVKNLNPDSKEFDFREVYIYRPNNKIQLIPETMATISPPKVTVPSVPENSELLPDPFMVHVPDGEIQTAPRIYLPEAVAVTSNSEKISGSTTIVVGGRFNGETQITYYRVDFNSGIDGHPFGQILRNHRYIFNIRKVMSSGWATPGEAANSLATSMNVEIQTWEDFSSEIYFDEHRFGISSREISLRYMKNRERNLEIESTLLYHIQWLDESGQPVGSSASDYNSVVSNDDFDAWITRESSDPDKVTRLVFRTRKDNYDGEIKTHTLRITVATWTIDILVTQDNTAMYSDRFFHILSADTYGNLGNLATASAGGLAMRAFLDKQFTPDGVIKIGGFAFMRVPNNNTAVGVTSGANFGQMKRIIGAQDVVYFPFDVRISDEIADVLLQWLDGSSHRVLIVGTDTDNTNQKLRNKLTEDGTWKWNSLSTVSTDFLRAADSEGSGDFFDGPFGYVPAGASIRRGDDTAGYSTDYSRESVTPLITGDRSGYTDYMFFGVNKKRRIIYHGDANLFVNAMSNTSGNVQNDLDKLMGNTWAWITEQIIYGNE